MDRTRRKLLRGAALLGAGTIAPRSIAGGQQPADQAKMHMHEEAQQRRPGEGTGSLAVITPDVPDLPYKVENGVKVFNLIAEPVKRKIVPYKMMEVWGYNGSCPGTTIQANQGDRVRIVFDNHLPESTTVHWHGLEIPIEMDGLPYITQKPIPPGGRFVYEFILHQEGTYFYHSH